MAIGLNGKMQGSVSGGCIENAVVSEAEETITTKKIRLLEYGVSNEDAFSVGLACGGKIRVFLEPIGSILPVGLLKELVESRLARRPVAYCVNINTGERTLAYKGHEARIQTCEQEEKHL